MGLRKHIHTDKQLYCSQEVLGHKEYESTAIEEAQDVKSMKVEELIGSLQTFEMEIIDHTEERKKGIAFQSNTSVDQTEGNLETNEESSEAIVLIGRQFNNILKKINGRCGTDVRNIPSDINRGSP